MIPETIDQIITKLHNKTKNGEANWHKTGRSSEFVLKMKSGSILVDVFEDEHGNDIADISIQNEDGDRVDYYRVNDSFDNDQHHEGYEKLKNLYDEIYRKYYKIEETLKGLLKEIDSDSIIGEEIIDEDTSDDDLPF